MRTAFRTAFIFAICFGIYLAFAGWSARTLAGDNLEVLRRWQALRGFAAIGVGSLMVFTFVAFYARSRQRTEEALKAELAAYRTQFDLSPLPTWVYDAETLRILAVNDAAIEEYGFSRRELLRSDVTVFHAFDSHDEVLSYHARLPAAIRSGQWTQVRQDGKKLSMEVISCPITLGEKEARIAVARNLKQTEVIENAFEGLLASASGERREIETARYFQSLLDEFFASAERNKLKLNLDLGGGLPKKMVLDTARVGCILKILIGEAVKFSTSGTLELSLRAKSGFPAGLELTLSEVDTVDERYRFKAPNFPVGRGRRHGFWSSLGLTLVERLSGQLGATVQVERNQSRCEVMVRLPGEIDATGMFVSASPDKSASLPKAV